MTSAISIAAFAFLLGIANVISTNQPGIVTRIVYDRTPPAGWMIIEEGPSGSRVVCPKPCERVKLPPPR